MSSQGCRIYTGRLVSVAVRSRCYNLNFKLPPMGPLGGMFKSRNWCQQTFIMRSHMGCGTPLRMECLCRSPGLLTVSNLNRNWAWYRQLASFQWQTSDENKDDLFTSPAWTLFNSYERGAVTRHDQEQEVPYGTPKYVPNRRDLIPACPDTERALLYNKQREDMLEAVTCGCMLLNLQC